MSTIFFNFLFQDFREFFHRRFGLFIHGGPDADDRFTDLNFFHRFHQFSHFLAACGAQLPFSINATVRFWKFFAFK